MTTKQYMKKVLFYITFVLLICGVCSVEDGFNDTESILYSIVIVVFGGMTFFAFKNDSKEEILRCIFKED